MFASDDVITISGNYKFKPEIQILDILLPRKEDFCEAKL